MSTPDMHEKGFLAINETLTIYDIDVKAPPEHKGNVISLHIGPSRSRVFSFHMHKKTAQLVYRALHDLLHDPMPSEE